MLWWESGRGVLLRQSVTEEGCLGDCWPSMATLTTRQWSVYKIHKALLLLGWWFRDWGDDCYGVARETVTKEGWARLG